MNVKVEWKNDEAKVWLDGKDISWDIVAGGLEITFPDAPDERPVVTLRLVADVDLDLEVTPDPFAEKITVVTL